MDPITLQAAKADAAKKYGALRYEGLALIAEGRTNPSSASPSTSQSASSRVAVIPTTSSSHVVLAYANITAANTLGEWGGESTVKVTAALEYLAGGGVTSETGQRVPVKFSGRWFGEIPPGSLLFSDPIPFDVVAGTQFFVRTNYQTAGANMTTALGCALQGGTGVGGVNNGDASTSFAATAYGSIGTGNLGTTTSPGPVAILGFVASPPATAAILGDSIQAGTGDGGYGRNDGGYLVRACANQTAITYTYPNTPPIAYVRCARGGESLSQWLTQASSLTGGYSTFSVVRSQIADLASTVLFAYGTNDLATALATVKANYIQAANSFLRRGKRFAACTLLPRTTSTDGFVTVVNQTVGANEATRTAFNTWLRDGTFAAATAAPGRCFVFDAAAAVEVNSSGVATLNGGYWIPAPGGGTPTVTGTLTSGSGTGTLNDTGKTWTQDQYRGFVARITSGSASNLNSTILGNSSTALTIGTLGTAPTTGDTYQIFQTYTIDGTHPTSYGHAAIAATFNRSLVQ